jgi:lipopolysaccharide export system permease protein
MRQLTTYNDSVKSALKKSTETSMKASATYLSFVSANDSGDINYRVVVPAAKKTIKEIIPDSAFSVCMDMAISKLGSAKSDIEYLFTNYKERSKEIRKFDIEWQRKIALSAACFVLFLIGAPLGSIIRKGGLGAPLVFGIIFFVIFHLLNTFGEKLAKEGVMSPFGGMWMASMVLLPLGIFLTYKALNDSELLNKEFYYRSFNSLKSWWNRMRGSRIKN